MSSENDTEDLTNCIAGSDTLQLAALAKENRFDSSVGERFDRIVRIACRLLDVPVAAVTLFHHDAEWFKSVRGWTITNLPMREGLGCIAAEANEPVIIADTRTDERTMGNSLVTAPPAFRFYAGVPLYEGLGSVVGTFSVFDFAPKDPQTVDIQSIYDLGALAQNEILSDQIDGAQQALTSKLGAARREALIDPLTRVWNRRGGHLSLRTALTKADHLNQPVTVCLIDVDRFKSINDTYGHDIGDIVLRKIAEAIGANLRENDVICRLGGDEFLLVLHGADEAIAAIAIDRVRASLAEAPLRTRQGDVSLTISAGYAVRVPRSPRSAEEMILLADQALIASKSAGRNCIQAAIA